jgi:hypothetical protein
MLRLWAEAAFFWQAGNLLVMSKANVRLEYNLNKGMTTFNSGAGLRSGHVISRTKRSCPPS